MRCRAFFAACGGFCFPHYLFFSVRKEAGKRAPRGAGGASLGGLFRRCWVPRRKRVLLLPTASAGLPPRLCCGLPFLFRPPIRRPAYLVLRGAQACAPCAGEAFRFPIFSRRSAAPSARLAALLVSLGGVAHAPTARFVRKPHGGLPRSRSPRRRFPPFPPQPSCGVCAPAASAGGTSGHSSPQPATAPTTSTAGAVVLRSGGLHKRRARGTVPAQTSRCSEPVAAPFGRALCALSVVVCSLESSPRECV